ncbi:MAG: YhfH family protein [Kurthia sp.]
MQKTMKKVDPKLCRECGCEIKEQVESTLYECERCMGICES